jgi:hypothetical protein
MPSGKIEWDYYVPFFDFTKQKAAEAYLQSARNTLSAARGMIDGVFADSSGDARVSGTGNWHLNQTDEFIQVRSYALLEKETRPKLPTSASSTTVDNWPGQAIKWCPQPGGPITSLLAGYGWSGYPYNS